MNAKDKAARLWWNDLNNEQKQQVDDWLDENPMPDEWIQNGWTFIDWAYTECPRGFLTRKYGHIL